ncbi:MAG: hypothetical protein B7Z45_10610 [Azorhizobium sp. 12-66-6]|nr:MAG: hypothetical protein B7Z45_10610 [Azorhizobium sp. 12-66-6]
MSAGRRGRELEPMARTDVVVLGAGMVGVSTALSLRRKGLSVALIDRRAPGEETSFGNAGLATGLFPRLGQGGALSYGARPAAASGAGAHDPSWGGPCGWCHGSAAPHRLGEDLPQHRRFCLHRRRTCAGRRTGRSGAGARCRRRSRPRTPSAQRLPARHLLAGVRQLQRSGRAREGLCRPVRARGRVDPHG